MMVKKTPTRKRIKLASDWYKLISDPNHVIRGLGEIQDCVKPKFSGSMIDITFSAMMGYVQGKQWKERGEL